MSEPFGTLSHIRLKTATTYVHPPELPNRAYLNSPAIDVMTDFNHDRPRTTRPDVPVDEALKYMKRIGVRLLLVEDEARSIVGIISSYDIQGERPIKLVQESRVSRSKIRVADIMTPHKEIEALHMLSVRNAQVGHIVATLRALEQRHLLVVQSAGENGEPGNDESMPSIGSGRQVVRGLFSSAQIGRQLRVDVDEIMTPAHSLAEMQRGLGG
ncbi:MAG: CBS domain-containing protein [Gammaproteobacteria bacterium]|nr:CBS domain-containing protein [Gammaproteobacteria bacterium]MDH3413749.1 CBS domain-containing protein [Gammaproteobacteria bacterium]